MCGRLATSALGYCFLETCPATADLRKQVVAPNPHSRSVPICEVRVEGLLYIIGALRVEINHVAVVIMRWGVAVFVTFLPIGVQ